MILVSTVCNNVSTLCIIDNVNGNVSDNGSLNGTSTSVTGMCSFMHLYNLAIFIVLPYIMIMCTDMYGYYCSIFMYDNTIYMYRIDV